MTFDIPPRTNCDSQHLQTNSIAVSSSPDIVKTVVSTRKVLFSYNTRLFYYFLFAYRFNRVILKYAECVVTNLVISAAEWRTHIKLYTHKYQCCFVKTADRLTILNIASQTPENRFYNSFAAPLILETLF